MSKIIERSPASYIWEGSVPILVVSQEEIEDLTEELIKRIIEAKYQLDLVISIAQSGVSLGYDISKIFGVPHAIFRAKSYSTNSTNHNETQQGVIIADHSLFIDSDKGLTALPANLSIYYKRVLVVDHLIDSGKSIDAIIKKLQARHTETSTIHTACLWLKRCSKVEPNYYGTMIEPEPESGKIPWILEPKDILIHKLRNKFIIKPQ